MRRAALSLVILGMLCANASALIVIDDFEDPATNRLLLELEPVDLGQDFEDGLAPHRTLGGRREYLLTVISGDDGAKARIQTQGTAGSRYLAFSNDRTVSSVMALGYGIAGELNADMELVSHIAMRIAVDHDTAFRVMVMSDMDGLPNMAVGEFALPAGYDDVFTFGWEDLVGDVDATDVDAIELDFGYAAELDDQQVLVPNFDEYAVDLQLGIDFIRAHEIPEPATLTLVGVSVVGMVLRRRRRRK